MEKQSEIIVMGGNEKLPRERHNTPMSTDSPIHTIAKLASSGASLEVIQQMKDLVEWEESRRNKAEFNAAFSMAKWQFKKAKKSGYNSHLQSHYSTLSDYDDATKEGLSENGLSWRHNVHIDVNEIVVTCILSHRAGHYEDTKLRAGTEILKNNAVNSLQSMGSVQTYLKRMTLCALLGIVSGEEVDDDGNAAGDASTPQAKAPKPKTRGAGSSSGKKATEGQVRLLKGKLANAGKTEEDFCKAFEVAATEEITMDQVNDAIAWVTQ